MQTTVTLFLFAWSFQMTAQLTPLRNVPNTLGMNASPVSSTFEFFPSNNETQTHLFIYGNTTSSTSGVELLKNSGMVFNTKGERVAIGSEIIADYFGPVRVGISTLLSNNKTEKIIDSTGNVSLDTLARKDNSIHELISGGGNVALLFSYPLLNAFNTNQKIVFKGVIDPRLSWDVPAIGTQTSQVGFNADLGASFHAFLTGNQNNLSFFFDVRPSIILGNGIFFDKLDKEDKKNFFFMPLTFGISLNKYFQISWTNYVGAKFVKDNFESSVSLRIIPD